MKETKLFEPVTSTLMKPWLSRNMLPKINTCENGWSNFSANLRVVSLKLLELAQFAWPNLSIYFNFLRAVPSDDVIDSPRFLMRPPVNHCARYKFCNLTSLIQQRRKIKDINKISLKFMMLTDNNQIFRNCFVIIYCHLIKVSS